ncbi:hypothetical protein QBC33DRAFT_553474 [Phialemonium atrogriseum]|uniref:Uncharacterized protein n=1 Tax=Phialemonium atrogriseum TaxID=1093897 RepID=A0AAJ0BQR2_9PEZI|nr:uncharacterized protein QBC33DRAFT_553474 [Phialemonium atrogriseum]KAK1761673.1 hypothetical protein QBC33DRAFT_553474 [Phialemonium atrogriseum]
MACIRLLLGNAVQLKKTSWPRRCFLGKDPEDIQNLRKLKMVLEASAGHRGDITESTQELIDHGCQDRILRTLWFKRDRRPEREHRRCTPENPNNGPWSRRMGNIREITSPTGFALVLASTGVSGKAGSVKSKSTLMKHETERDAWTDAKGCFMHSTVFEFLSVESPYCSLEASRT